MVERILKKIYRKIQGKKERVLKPSTFEDQLYYSIIKVNDVCYDIGANDGGVSMLLSELTGAKGMVYAFEPVWRNYELMLTYIYNHSFLKARIIPIPVALSNQIGKTVINIPNGDYGMGSVADLNTWSKINDSSEIVIQDCLLLTLDYFIETTKIQLPDFIKIDVEGAELFVLKGAGNLFESGHTPIMLIEIFAPWEKAFNYQPIEVFTLLKKYDYSFLFVCPEGLIEFNPSYECQFPKEYINGYNVIAFNQFKHRDRIDGLKLYLWKKNNLNVLPMEPASFDNVIQ